MAHVEDKELEKGLIGKAAEVKEELEKIPGLSLQTEAVQELIATAVKRFKWVIGFMGLTDQFNFEVLARMNYVPTLGMDTMGVAPKGITIDLAYNPLFVAKLSDEELRYVLSHEVLHIVLHHVTVRAPSDPSEMKLHNYGADLAINSLVPSEGNRCYPTHKEDKLDKSGKVIAKKGAPWILLPKQFDFKEKLSTEQYIHLLREKYKDTCPTCGKKHKTKEEKEQEEEKKKGQGQPQAPGDEGEEQEGKGEPGEGEGEEGNEPGEGGGKGGCEPGEGEGCGGTCECDEQGVGSFDDHSGWDKSEMADAQIREWVNGIESKKAWGNTSLDAQEMIRAAQKSEVPWTSILRHYYGQISTSSQKATYKRPSRRMWYPWSGRVRETVDKKLVGIDDSGSVSSKMLGKFLTETNKLAQVQPVDMITWDAGLTMKKAISWEKKPKSFAFQGRGGTDPQPCLDYAKDNGYKEVIMLTDGYFSPVKAPTGVRVLWVITPDGTVDNLTFGTIIKMKEMPR